MRSLEDSHAGDVYDAVDVFDGLVEDSKLLKVFDLDKIEFVGVLRASFDHGIAFGQRSGCTADPDAPGQENVDNMGTDESRCARY